MQSVCVCIFSVCFVFFVCVCVCLCIAHACQYVYMRACVHAFPPLFGQGATPTPPPALHPQLSPPCTPIAPSCHPPAAPSCHPETLPCPALPCTPLHSVPVREAALGAVQVVASCYMH